MAWMLYSEEHHKWLGSDMESLVTLSEAGQFESEKARSLQKETNLQPIRYKSKKFNDIISKTDTDIKIFNLMETIRHQQEILNEALASLNYLGNPHTYERSVSSDWHHRIKKAQKASSKISKKANMKL